MKLLPASGFDEDELLRHAAAGRLAVAVHAAGLWGYPISRDALAADRDVFTGPYAPIPADSGEEEWYVGTLFPERPRDVAAALLDRPDVVLQVFEYDFGGTHAYVFRTEALTSISRASLLLRAFEVEALRLAAAKSITKEQLKAAKAVSSPWKATKGTTGRLSTFLDGYMASKSIKPDEAARIRTLQTLFIQVTRDPHWPHEVNNEVVEGFQNWLTQVPEHEEKIRLRYSTKSIQESIDAVAERTTSG